MQSRIRLISLFCLGFVVVITAFAVSAALDPTEDALWLTWGYLQKGAVLMVVASAWPVTRMTISTYLNTFDDDEDELERVTRNPRVPEAQ